MRLKRSWIKGPVRNIGIHFPRVSPIIFSMPFLFFGIALLYTMAGFGGGSSYLAILSLTDRPLDEISTLALICNLGATFLGTYHFIRVKKVLWNQALPFLAGSIPAAFVGGALSISPSIHLILLAFSLSLASIYLFRGVQDESDRSIKAPPHHTLWFAGAIVGVVIGLLSGIVGIGGGIFLAPLLYALRWANARHIAGISAFFIFCNSLSGLFGRWTRMGDLIWNHQSFTLLIAVLLGAFIGSRLASVRLAPSTLRLLTGLLIAIVALRLWMRWFSLYTF